MDVEPMRGRLTEIKRDISEFFATEYLRSVGEVDDQHDRILEMWGEFVDALLGDCPGDEAISGKVRELLLYVKLHFTVEETYMALIGYPEAEAHKLLHRSFLDEVGMLMQAIGSGARSYGDFAVLSGEWLLDHERTSDKDFAMYAAAQA